MIDDRTPAQALPLPHPQNLLQEDVPRLRQALALLDELLAPGGHGHAVADISGLTTLLQPLASKTYVDEQTAQRAPANHSHSLASLGAAAVNHRHAAQDVDMVATNNISIDYVDGRIASVTADGVTTHYTYNADGTVNTISYPRAGKTRTETYNYNADGTVAGMSATEA